MATANDTTRPDLESALMPCSIAQGRLTALFEALYDAIVELPNHPTDERANGRLNRAICLASLGCDVARRQTTDLDALEVAIRGAGNEV